MGMKIGEFFVALGVDIESKDKKNLDDVIKGMANLDINAVASAAGLGVAFVALKKMTEQAVKTGHALMNFNIQTGISTKNLQQWSFFAEKMGATAGDVESAVKSLQLSTAAIKIGQGNLKPFQMLGVDPNQDPFAILEDVAERIKDLDPGMTRLITQQMGISDAMLNVLKTSKDVREDIKKQFFIREKEISQLNDLRKIWVNLRQSIFHFSNMITVDLIPVFKNLYRPIDFVVKGFLDLIGGAENLKYVIPLVVTAFSPMTAMIVLIIALVDDLYTLMDTGETAFAPFFELMEKGWSKVEKLISKANKGIKEFKKHFGIGDFPYEMASLKEQLLGGGIPQFRLKGQGGKGDTKVDVYIDGVKQDGNVRKIVKTEINSLFSTSSSQTPLESR